MPAQASAPVSQDAAMVGPTQNQSELDLQRIESFALMIENVSLPRLPQPA